MFLPSRYWSCFSGEPDYHTILKRTFWLIYDGSFQMRSTSQFDKAFSFLHKLNDNVIFKLLNVP